MKSLTTHWEVFQGFRFFGHSQTSHDSKNRCVTWLRLDLYCIISQSVSQSVNMCTQTQNTVRSVLKAPLSFCWSPFDCFHVLWEISLFFFMWCAAGGGAGGSRGGVWGVGGWLSDSCFPSVLQSSSRPVVESRRATGRNSKKRKCLQLEGRPNLFPHILVLVSASGSKRPAYQASTRNKRAATIWEWLCLFLTVFHPFTSVQLCRDPLSMLACSGSGSLPPVSVIQDWYYLRALIHTLTHRSPLQEQILDGDLRCLFIFTLQKTIFEENFTIAVLFSFSAHSGCHKKFAPLVLRHSAECSS